MALGSVHPNLSSPSLSTQNGPTMTPNRSSTRSGLAILRLCGFALLAIGPFASGSAEAAHCGGYTRASAGFDAAMTRLFAPENADGATASPFSIPIPPPAPCSGASCSGRDDAAPSVPPMPQAPSTSSADTQWAWKLAEAAASPDRARALATPEDDVRPIHVAAAIFHPPRVAARPA